MKHTRICSLLAALPVLLAAMAVPAAGQNARWPGSGGAEAAVLRAYGTGSLVDAMREAATEFSRRKGVLVNITAGPVQTWKQAAIRDGDIVFTDSEYDMNSLAQRDLPAIIDTATTRIITLHPSAIMVRSGNPKSLRGLKDLGRPGIKLLTVAAPSEPAGWEAIAKQAGGEKLVDALRRNIGAQPPSSTEAQALWLDDPSYDAWLVIRPGQKQSPAVITRQENTIYRSCVMAVTSRTPQKALAEEFMDFTESAQGQAIFAKWSGQGNR